MTARVAQIWRHPIKAHGRERLERVTLAKGQTMPGDRVWAVAHDRSSADGAEWVVCGNFSRGSKSPALQGIHARTHEDGRLTLTHPDLAGDLTFDPETEAEALIAWSAPLTAEGQPAPARLIRVPGRGMTDSDFPSISLINLSSHRAVEQAAGKPLSALRWRGNLLIEGLAPWEEFDLVGREVTIGTARLAIRERIIRCNATRANPETGKLDADTLTILQTRWGHQDLGVYGEVLEAGEIAEGDTLAPA